MGNLSVAVLSLSDPDEVRTGGTVRTRALVAGLVASGADVKVFFPQQAGSAVGHGGGGKEGSTAVGPSRGERWRISSVGRWKRHFLPMPTMSGGKNEALENAMGDEGPFDLVVVSALSQFSIASSLGCPVWLDFMDLWSDFCRHESRRRRGLARWTSGLQARHLHRLELAAAEASSVVTAVGNVDVRALSESGSNVRWLPVSLPDSEFVPVRARTVAVRRVGFVGNFTFWPNLDAYRHLCDSWAPKLSLLGIEILVAGHGSASLPVHDAVTILGPVAEMAEFYDQVDATVAPIGLGGGMKVKVLESLARGVPVVGSPRALEGLSRDLRNVAYEVDLDDPDFGFLESPIKFRPTEGALMPYRNSNAFHVIENLLSRFRARGA